MKKDKNNKKTPIMLKTVWEFELYKQEIGALYPLTFTLKNNSGGWDQCFSMLRAGWRYKREHYHKVSLY